MARRGDTAVGDEVYKERLKTELRSHYFSPNYPKGMPWNCPTRQWDIHNSSHGEDSLGQTWNLLTGGRRSFRTGAGMVTPPNIGGMMSPMEPAAGGIRTPSIRSAQATQIFTSPRGIEGAPAQHTPRSVPEFAKKAYSTCPGFMKPRNKLGPECTNTFASFQRVTQGDLLNEPRWRSLRKRDPFEVVTPQSEISSLGAANRKKKEKDLARQLASKLA